MPYQVILLMLFRLNDKYIMFNADKGVGPCIAEQEMYSPKAIKEHLSNSTNYCQLSKQQPKNLQCGVHYKFCLFIEQFYHEPLDQARCGLAMGVMPLSKAVVTFLTRALKQDQGQFPGFHMMAKVHKPVLKMRLIVSCCSTFTNYWSRWLAYKLQKLKPFIRSYLQDAKALIKDLKS